MSAKRGGTRKNAKATATALDKLGIGPLLGLQPVNQGACTGKWISCAGGQELISVSPADGSPIAAVRQADEAAYEKVVAEAVAAFPAWRMTPAPARGEVVRDLGNELRAVKEPLGKLVSLEMGKILSEGLGEVQEMIDMCDFAVGLSRQLSGPTMASERPRHRMYEQWHPLGVVGIITAFNFPVAVWAWNAALAAVCGDTMVWKPSSDTPLTAIAVQNICNRVMERHNLSGIFNLVIGPGRTVGERMINDRRVPLVSFTGSTAMGRRVSQATATRFGRSILELGGNNAILVEPDADLDLTLRAVLFAAVGTAGQRCTSLRRLFLHKKIAKQFLARLVKAYGSITIGNPLEKGVLMGPLVNAAAVEDYLAALATARKQGGKILYGGGVVDRRGFFVEPAIVKLSSQVPIAREETFAPILYVMEYDDLEQAIAVHNSVDQGLSSAVFTSSMYSAEKFLSHEGSDCGIANVNIGTSGAEIGGAFGGEKETGGGREAGSDAWKAYMRRQTCTINWSSQLPLAQGVKFDV
ncbi:MAG TPA: aldehyde dehydrogenase family protein [Thermoanaerobaculales bacterium]|nr:aldehyde dehydrogenase family protein [Thermoanaerobaculales bacterium]HPA80550.1 aldehyde dehydrogenase family protein [Thermoanaerobaculales bacterium]HQL29362.1 aldehyde dehydrogenase family protein [Thermoanaerobaculales bacterium]HQN96044.1 aldehyde dehydrogenase family protein [Thermoanaerobaculales bacterium]HQP43072.1 aldehyde dehydrogenase family protein [Thermoanaerobaculales bacterium]